MNKVIKSTRGLNVLVATDGSAQAKSAVATLANYPWPDATRVRVVVAQRFAPGDLGGFVDAALEKSAHAIADDARLALASLWPDATSAVANGPPMEGILAEAEGFGADILLVGWRGHGSVRRMLAGSVSRDLARRAKCSVLVVRKKQDQVREIVIGFDGSPKSQKAIELVAKLAVPKGGRVTILRTAERIGVPSQALVSAATRATVAAEIRRLNAESLAKARAETRVGATILDSRGWRVRIVVAAGEPLNDLLSEVERLQADLLVVGARGTSGVRQLLLGSVADGALNRCEASVLIAR
ncbi:MAG: universal stress protein [Bryobacteraceae bacterium]